MSTYNESSFKLLADWKAIRSRPSLYIGSTDDFGIHHLLSELIDNALDEHAAGFASTIAVTLSSNGSLTVHDNGRGIPSGIHAEMNVPTLELAFTRLNVGAKFDGDAYKKSGGLHGIGLKCVNALSDLCEVTVWREEKKYSLAFSRGQVIRQFTEEASPDCLTGTSVTIHPDPEIFGGLSFKREFIIDRLKAISFLNKGVTITFSSPDEETLTIQTNGGLSEFCLQLTEKADLLNTQPIALSIEAENFSFSAAIFYCNDLETETRLFTNNVPNLSGSHFDGFRHGFTKGINEAAHKLDLSSDTKITWDDVVWGMRSICSLRMDAPRFASQTKEILNASELVQPISDAVFEKVSFYFQQNPKIAKAIIARSATALKAREEARKKILAIKKAKNSSTGVAQMLYGTQSPDLSISELFIFTGKRLEPFARKHRDPVNQAVLAFRSSVPVCSKVKLEKLLNDESYRTLVSVLDLTMTEEGTFYAPPGRYSKIVIIPDGTAQGLNSAANLFSFFETYLKPLFVEHKICFCQPPANPTEDFVADVFKDNTPIIQPVRLNAAHAGVTGKKKYSTSEGVSEAEDRAEEELVGHEA